MLLTAAHNCSANVTKLSTRSMPIPRSGVVYNFGPVVCQTITFRRVDVGSLYSHMRYISMEYGSSSYMKVKVSVTGAKKLCFGCLFGLSAIVCMCMCEDEFEDESIAEKTTVKVPQTKSDTGSAAGEMSTAKDSRKESRKISVTAAEPRKRTREEEEYVPQPVGCVDLVLLMCAENMVQHT